MSVTAFICVTLLFGFIQLSSTQGTAPTLLTCALAPQTGVAFNGTFTFTCSYRIGSSGIGGTISSVTWTVIRGRSISGPVDPINSDFVPINAVSSTGTCASSQTAVNMFDCTNINAASDPNSVTFRFNVNDAIRASNWTFQFEATNSYDIGVTRQFTVPVNQPQLSVITNPSNASVLQSYIAGSVIPLTLTVRNSGNSAFNSPISCLITFNSGLAPVGTSIPAGCTPVSTTSAQCVTGNYLGVNANASFSFNATYTGGAASGSILNISCQDQKTLFPTQVRTIAIGGTQSPSVTPTISVSPSTSSTPAPSGASPSPASSTGSESSQGGSQGTTTTTTGGDGGNNGGAASSLLSWLSILN